VQPTCPGPTDCLKQTRIKPGAIDCIELRVAIDRIKLAAIVLVVSQIL
jgi:hypothetical protein